jgi:catechol 2,3-dioxygenase-like lactoylglutathione lyase family enzyme
MAVRHRSLKYVARMRALGIDHIVVICTDVDRTLAWWRDELDLQPVRLEEWRVGKAPFPSLRLNDSTIVDFIQGERRGENYAHVAVAVDVSRDDLAALATARGWDVAVPLNDQLFGARGIGAGIYIRDPEGNVVELRTYDVARQ